MSGGNFDFREVERLRDQLIDLQSEQDEFNKACLRELAARLLRKVKKRTPVDSGHLRRGWTVGEVEKRGDRYLIEIINPTEYSSYIEYGHRTASHNSWVTGHFMLTISEQEIRNMAPVLIERKLRERLGEMFHA